MPFANVHTDGLKREGTPRHVNYIHTPKLLTETGGILEKDGFFVNVFHALKWPA